MCWSQACSGGVTVAVGDGVSAPHPVEGSEGRKD
ncbi:MAG: hypothetical protein J07HX64_02232 [halophilic archaeon J07HX64]|nr:MAG: hypothetical protein J07HX64_02232 [halophilic archaeon J07HX64]